VAGIGRELTFLWASVGVAGAPQGSSARRDSGAAGFVGFRVSQTRDEARWATMSSGSVALPGLVRSMLVRIALGAVLAAAPVGVARALPPDAGAAGEATRNDSTQSDSSQPESAETDGATTAKAVQNFFDRIWGFATLYENPKNPVLQRFAIRGRFQADFPLFHSNQGEYSEAQVRRFRLGFISSWLADLTLHVEADLDLSCEQVEVCDDDAYVGLTDAYLGWAPSEAFGLKIGKMSARFTLDGSMSSNHLLTLERNNISNNLWSRWSTTRASVCRASPERGATWLASTLPVRPRSSAPSMPGTLRC
jgi:hypothetical protein